ncbi:hypothetical protein PUN28_019102 [Cardiocondyla obscurior]|uniref:Uncharacterized protein n=1 Tax=Cardiocondyla obscurior TaxID=286306 RepID=A0AAW2EHQ7_9HYME
MGQTNRLALASRESPGVTRGDLRLLTVHRRRVCALLPRQLLTSCPIVLGEINSDLDPITVDLEEWRSLQSLFNPGICQLCARYSILTECHEVSNSVSEVPKTSVRQKSLDNCRGAYTAGIVLFASEKRKSSRTRKVNLDLKAELGEKRFAAYNSSDFWGRKR